MDEEQDKDIVVEVADAVLNRYKNISSMSFDKGHWRPENRALLALEIPCVVLPKLGKRNAKEEEMEKSNFMWRSCARTCKKQEFFNMSSTQAKKNHTKMGNIPKNLSIVTMTKYHSEKNKEFSY